MIRNFTDIALAIAFVWLMMHYLVINVETIKNASFFEVFVMGIKDAIHALPLFAFAVVGAFLFGLIDSLFNK